MKYILITGSSRGLGFQIAKELSHIGFQIILVSKDRKNLKKAIGKLNPDLKHLIFSIDLTKKNSIKKLLEKIADLKIHSIIHNFGIKLDNDIHPIDVNLLRKSIEINFIKSLEINNALVDSLCGDPSKIIYIGSSASLHAKASPCYTLSKSLINTYVKNISSFYIDKNVSICAILPGILGHKGSEWDKKKKEESEKYYDVMKKQPLKRFIMPEDISPYIIDLISNESFLHTGSIIKLDANSY